MRFLPIIIALVFLSTPASVINLHMQEPFRRPLDTTQILTRIAFGSCNNQHEPQDMWKTIMGMGPELWIWLGDNVYANTTSPHQLVESYDKQLSHPEYQQLLSYCPVIGTWDDHDYGYDQASKANPMREESQQRFLEFIGATEDDPRHRRPGVYGAYTFGSAGRSVQIILLDTRYFRDGPGDSAKLLGEAQWTWLEGQLCRPANLLILGSGMQVLSTKPNHDTWYLFPQERNRLLSLLDSTGVAHQTIFISGDIHFTEALAARSPAGTVVSEFTSSGLTHSDALGSCCYDSLSLTGPVSARNFGFMTIDWNLGQVAFSGNGIDGRPLVSAVAHFSPTLH